MAAGESEQEPVVASIERQCMAILIADGPEPTFVATHRSHLVQKGQEMVQPGLAAQCLRDGIQKRIDSLMAGEAILEKSDLSQACAYLSAQGEGAGPESKFGLLLGAERKPFGERLTGKRELQDHRRARACVSKEPGTLHLTAFRLLNDLAHDQPGIPQGLATCADLLLRQIPADQQAHLLAHLRGKRVLQAKSVGEQ